LLISVHGDLSLSIAQRRVLDRERQTKAVAIELLEEPDLAGGCEEVLKSKEGEGKKTN
jgi:hypothetical protein